MALSACTYPGAVMHCIDGAVPRPVMTKSFHIEVEDDTGQLLAQSEVTCERYYDANCSVRGNHYAYRRLTEHEGVIAIPAADKGILELTFPACKTLFENQNIHPAHFGRRYIDSTGKSYTHIYYYAAGVDRSGRSGFMFHNEKGDAVWLGDPFTARKTVIEETIR